MNKDRLNNLRVLLKQEKLDGFLISNFINIFYLTGFKTLSPTEREAFVLITKKNVYLLTDGRHDVSDLPFETRLFTQQMKLTDYLQEIIKQEQIKQVGFESIDLKYAEYEILSKKLDINFKPQKKIIEQLRQIKDEEEIAKIRKACEVSDDCLEEIIKTIKVGQTEKEIAFRIEFWLKEKGYRVAFYPIVAVNENAATPHYDTKTLGGKKVTSNSLLLIDMGTKYQDYCADITRVFFISKVNDELKNVYLKLLDAQEETITKANKFSQLNEVDSLCRNLLQKDGLPNFPHSTGHGVGLEVHESPSVSQKSKDALIKNQVFTIEPGVYIKNKYGMRIEDTVWFTGDKVEVLTKFPKEIKVI